MTHLRKSCPGRGFAVAALALSGLSAFPPAPASAQGCGGALSTSTGNLIGSAVGGAAGGLLGNQFGRGTGKGVMTGVGVIGGALAGGYVGRSAEGCGGASSGQPAPQAQHRAAHHSHASAPAPARTASDNRTCRYVSSETVIDGRKQQIDAIACLDPADGSWKVASGSAAEQAAQTDLVLRAQQRLHDQGFYVRDNIDGHWGAATSSALNSFQRANGLAATGQLDAPTRKALELDSAPVAGASPTPEGDAVQAASIPAAPARPVPPSGPVAAENSAPRAEKVKSAQ